MKSLGTMVQELWEFLVKEGTDNDWEVGFIRNIYTITDSGKDTTRLSEKQVEMVEKLHKRYCA